MAIPTLTADGHLPPGIHVTTLDQIEEAFGQGPVRRGLMADFRRYVQELRRWAVGQAVLVVGSFVTDEPEPHDIDVILILRADYDLGREVPPVEYNVRRTRTVRRQFGLDLLAVEPNSFEYERLARFFTQVRNQPGHVKGLLRVSL